MLTVLRALTVDGYSFNDRVDCSPPNNYNVCNEVCYDSSSSDCYRVPPNYYKGKGKSKGSCDQNINSAAALLSQSLSTISKELQLRVNELLVSLSVTVSESGEVNLTELQEQVSDTVTRNCTQQDAEITIIFNALVENINERILQSIRNLLGSLPTIFNGAATNITAAITALGALPDADVLTNVRDLATGINATLLGINTATQTAVSASTRHTESNLTEDVEDILREFQLALNVILSQTCSQITSEVNALLEENLSTAETETTSNIDELKTGLSTQLRSFETKAANAIQDWISYYLASNKKDKKYKGRYGCY